MTYSNIEALSVSSATLNATGDLSTNLTVGNQGVAIFNTTQHLASLTIGAGGLARIASGANKVLVTNSLAIAPTASLDLRDNKLIVHTPPGSWNGSAYTGVAGMIRTGRNGGAWNGMGGIVTSDPRALPINGAVPAASIAFAKAGAVRNVQDNETAIFAGETVLGSDTVVMFTWAGDATLDGKINIDDYVRIDAGLPIAASGYFNGDINYDGKINIDDYLIFDTNIVAQGPQLANSPFSSASASAVGAAGASVWIPINEIFADRTKDDDDTLLL